MREKTDIGSGRKIFSVFLTLLFLLPVSSIVANAAAPTDLTVVGTATPNPVEVGETVFFRAMVSIPPDAPSGELVYSWSCSDGGQISGNPATYVFAQKGTFTVTVTATLVPYQSDVADGDGDGGGDGDEPNPPTPNLTATDTFTVWVSYKPRALFSASTTEPRAYLDSVHFDASGSYDPDGSIVSYKWDFGDGSTASGVTADHVFADGSFKLSLTVTDNIGLKSRKTVIINSHVPVEAIEGENNLTEPQISYSSGKLYLSYIDNSSTVYFMRSLNDGGSWDTGRSLFEAQGKIIRGLRIDSEKDYLALTFYTMDRNDSGDGYAHHQYVLFSDDGGINWGDPYMVHNYSDNGDIDISNGVVYLTYLEYHPWINIGSSSPSIMAAPPHANPAFYITVKLIWRETDTIVEKELKYDGMAVYGIPRVSVNASRIDVAVAELNSSKIYYWTSSDSGTTWTDGEMITNYSGDVKSTGFDIVSAHEKTYLFWFRNTSATGINLMDRELFMKVRNNGEWGNDIILTTAYYDSQDISAVLDMEGNIEVMWADKSNGEFLTPHTVELDSNGYIKFMNRSLVDYGPGQRPSVAVSSKTVPGHPDMHYNFMVWQSFENGKWLIRYRDNVMNISVLSSTTTMSSLVSSAKAYVQEMPDDHFSNSYLRTPLTKQYEVVGRLVSKIQDVDNKTAQTDNPIQKRMLGASRRALLQAMSAHLTYNIIPRMDGSSGGNPNNDWVVSSVDQKNLNNINNALLTATAGISITSCSHSETPTSATISFSVDWGDSTSNFYASAYLNEELKYSNQKRSSYTFTFSGLTPDTSYSCHISASADLPDGTQSIDTLDCSITTRPPTPVISDVKYIDKTYTDGDFSWSVYWPASGSQVSSAEIYDSSGTLQWSGTPSMSADGKYHLDLAGVKRGETYSYTMTATYNNDYTSTKSGSFEVLLPSISDVKVVDISETYANITWKVDHYFSGYNDVALTIDGQSVTPAYDETDEIHYYNFDGEKGQTYSYTITVTDPNDSDITESGMFYLSSPTADIVKSKAGNLAKITWIAGTGSNLKGDFDIYWRKDGGNWKHDAIFENPDKNKHTYSIAGLADGLTYEYYLASDTSNGYVQTAVKSFTMSQYGLLAEDMFSNIQQKQHWNPAGEIITFSLGEGVSPADVGDLRVYYRTKGGSYTAANSEALQVQDDGSYILVLTGLTAETDYQYLIVLTKTSGELYMSAEHGFRALHDTDGDGMCDGEEDYGWKVYVDLNGDGDTNDSYEDYRVTSDLSKPDTDGEGLNDTQEKSLGTNPRYYDTDWDGLTDKYEVETDWSALVGLQATDPLEVDTDGDTLSDGYEAVTDWDLNTDGVQRTDPLNPDTDGDTLTDGEEVNVYGTNPILSDTDWDGSWDGTEVKFMESGANPTERQSILKISLSSAKRYDFGDHEELADEITDAIVSITKFNGINNPNPDSVDNRGNTVGIVYPYSGEASFTFSFDVDFNYGQVVQDVNGKSISLDYDSNSNQLNGKIHFMTGDSNNNPSDYYLYFTGEIVSAMPDEPPWAPLTRELAPHQIYEDMTQEFPTSIFYDGDRDMSNNGLPATWPDGTVRDHWFTYNTDTDQELASQPHGNKYYSPDYARQQLQNMGLDSSGDDATVLDIYHREITSVYTQAFEKDGLIGIQYWFYYVFHDDPGHQPHPHDWWYFWVVYDENAYRPTTAVFDFHHNLRALDFNDDAVHRDGFFHVKTYHDASHRAMYAPGDDITLAGAREIDQNDLYSALEPLNSEGDEIFGAMIKYLDHVNNIAEWRGEDGGLLDGVIGDWDAGQEYDVEDFKHWVWVYNAGGAQYEKVSYTGDNIYSGPDSDLWPSGYLITSKYIRTYLPWCSGVSWAPNQEGVRAISSPEMVWKWSPYQFTKAWDYSENRWAYFYKDEPISPSIYTRYYDGSP